MHWVTTREGVQRGLTTRAEVIVEAPSVPEINSTTKEWPEGLYDVNPDIVKPIPVP